MKEPKKLHRSSTDKKIAGVCGGIGEYLNIDSTAIRVIFVLFLIFSAVFPAVITYIILVLIIPLKPLPGEASL